jgi:hypothetical protein
MVEMRWITRTVYPQGTGPSDAALPKKERVLQYREGQYDDKYWDGKDYIWERTWYGSDWKDVEESNL